MEKLQQDNYYQTGMKDGIGLDVAIIGGGVSGCYTGYRLRTGSYNSTSTPTSVAIFEMSDRIGGRLESVMLPGMDIWGELGGMRYITSQAIATTLIEKVFRDKINWVDFPVRDDATNKCYLRKQRFHADSWTKGQKPGNKPFTTRYNLNDGDVGHSAYQLFNKVIFNVLKADKNIEEYHKNMKRKGDWDYDFTLTSKEWDAIKLKVQYCFPGPYEGLRVNDMGFWNLLKDQCSAEGYAFLADAGGYHSNTINWNAAEAFENMVGDFTVSSISYRTIEEGFDKIVKALAYEFRQQPDTSIWLRNRLIGVDQAAEGASHRYVLRIWNQQEAREWKAYANAVVLAVPRRSLELLDQNCFLFKKTDGGPTELARSLPDVLLQPSMKILMGFEYPWWKEDFGTVTGMSVTDLPMRQCYYFGTNSYDSHSLFLGSYNDMQTVSFWSPLQPPESSHPQRSELPLFEPQPTKLVAKEDLNHWRGVQAPQVMVDEVMAQVRELHGGPRRMEILNPYITYYKNWAEDPYGGGYHAWAAGVSIKEVMPLMRQPLGENEAIHVCGECYSDLQGWIEGALCVTEHMLQDHFHMNPPDWLSKDYYLGW